MDFLAEGFRRAWGLLVAGDAEVYGIAFLTLKVAVVATIIACAAGLPFGYFLAFSRLAPVQCVSFGHPDTTGIPTMDYFVSNDLYETPGSEAHYSERLFRLHDLASLAYYYRPERSAQRKDRRHFGLLRPRHVDALRLLPEN